MSSPPELNVVRLNVWDLSDPVASLRRVADDIEQGKFGEVGCVAVALLGDELSVFSAGRDSAGPSAATVLYAGFLRLVRGIEEHGR